ncbi:serine/threonine-protein kinase [Sporobolomyces koalae]|uniref:serine/threonine-protein kinase n=1 Tax=Sporobolomyces koalae TaxID=500713 RepID=UPI0031770B5E
MPDSIAYSPRPRTNSTFFVPTGSQSPSVPLPDLPFPRSILLSSPTRPSPVHEPLASSPPAVSFQPPTFSSRVPLPQSSSILLHGGFWDLLSATGSRFYSPSKIATRQQQAEDDAKMKVKTERIGKGIASKPTDPRQAIEGGNVHGTPGIAQDTGSTRQKRRVSKDMVGQPRAFAHLVHASDAEQAEALLMRWHLDKQGKLGQPAWARPIKTAVREAKAAVGINEAIIARDDHRGEIGGQGELQVMNGLPDSAFSHSSESRIDISIDTGLAVENENPAGDMPSPALSPGFDLNSRSASGDSIVVTDTAYYRTGDEADRLERTEPLRAVQTVKFSPLGYTRPGVPLSWDSIETPTPSSLQAASQETIVDDFEPSPLSDPFALPSKFIPSLTTIEKAVSTKVYLETKYHSLLKTPPSRETRKRLLEKELTRLNLRDDQKDEVRDAWRLSETEYLRDMRARVGVGSFKRLKVIGRGAFGVVSLVRETGSGEVYAMKQLRKSDMLRKGQEGHVRAERDLLASAAMSTRWTVRLAYSFQDVDNLYLVCDFMGGGDLLTLLIEKDVFEESFARFYIAEMLLAIQETHQVLGAIHRDVKPDNFLFSNTGHIAMSDFGLATDFHWSHDGAYYESQRRELLYKHGIDLDDSPPPRSDHKVPFDPPRDWDDEAGGAPDEGPKSVLGWRDKNRRRMAYSVVGTNNYMAVEVLRGAGYGVQADWWSLGVIMFEMLYGYPPFVSKSRQQTRQKILNWRQALRFPSKPKVSREAQDLILSLICEKEARLGSRRVERPNSVLTRQRSGFLNVTGAGALPGSPADDGAEAIKAHPWFKGIDWSTLHLQTPPFQPKLSSATDTRYFEDDIEAVPLPAPEIAPGVPAPDITRDPMLRHAIEGDQLLELRKTHAFKDWTFKKPKKPVYDPRRGLDLSQRGDIFGKADGAGTYRGRSTLRSEGAGSSLVRSLSV